jgi:hypothetical protein
MKQVQLTAIIEREGDGYVSLCPEFDIASQGDTIESARKNLQGPSRYSLGPPTLRRSCAGSTPRFL